MKRELKFRAWDKKEKKMIPAIGLTEDGTPFLMKSVYKEKIGVELRKQNASCLAFGKDEVVVMQFIDRKDRNGKEMYEGDIVRYAEKKRLCPVCSKKEISEELSLGISQFCPSCGTKTIYEDFVTTAKVVFDRSGYAYHHENDNDTYQSWPTHSAEMYIEWVEVIGNIYETPNLLKVKVTAA